MSYIETNACSKEIRSKRTLVLYSKCIEREHPEILEELAKDAAKLSVCLESTHMNMVGFKLVTTLRACPPDKLIVLTVDGSPHCIQLHYLVEEAVKATGYKGEVKHYVTTKGKLYEVPKEAVKLSRYLHKIARLITGGIG